MQLISQCGRHRSWQSDKNRAPLTVHLVLVRGKRNVTFASIFQFWGLVYGIPKYFPTQNQTNLVMPLRGGIVCVPWGQKFVWKMILCLQFPLATLAQVTNSRPETGQKVSFFFGFFGGMMPQASTTTERWTNSRSCV